MVKYGCKCAKLPNTALKFACFAGLDLKIAARFFGHLAWRYVSR